jgi:hypothetical protein
MIIDQKTLKETAKRLKKEEFLTQAESLNRAANVYGFSDHRHYLYELRTRELQSSFRTSEHNCIYNYSDIEARVLGSQYI